MILINVSIHSFYFTEHKLHKNNMKNVLSVRLDRTAIGTNLVPMAFLSNRTLSTPASTDAHTQIQNTKQKETQSK